MQKSFSRLAMMGPLAAGILLSSNVTNAGETMKTNDTNTSKTAATGFVPPKRNTNIKYINPELPAFKLPEFKGTRYQDTVPDTLDLTDRAALAVNGLTAVTDDENNAELYWCGSINGMYHDLNDWCEYKYYAPSVLLRQVCGSQERLDVEWHRMANLLQMQGTNGLFWIPIVGRPWAKTEAGGFDFYDGGGKEQTTAGWIHGRILESLGVYYRMTGDERWKQMGDKAVAALGRLVVDRGDHAYFLQTVYSPEEAAKPQEGPVPPPSRSHGTAWVAHGLTTYYRLTQSKPALDLARKLARFYLKTGGLTGPNGEFYGSHEDKELKPYNEGPAHFHMNSLARIAMLNAGIESGDRELIEMAQRGYAHGRKIGDPLSGYFPERFAGMKHTVGYCEPCCVADMLFLALRQSTAGVADCWDDVDRWVRNIFVEAQLTDVAWMKSRSGPTEVKPYGTTTNLPERVQGIWCGLMNPNEPRLDWLMSCCTGNSAMQLFRVWRDMLSFDSGKNRLSVHLLLNRASPWGDVYSYIPNKGLVEVKLKRDCEVAVRIPEWTQPQECKVQSGGKDVVSAWEGRYAIVKGRKGETVSFSCPIAERTEKVRIGTGDYEVVVRGNTIVEMKPGGHAYQRNDYRQPEPRMKQVERFVAEKVEMSY
jgi:hypothetical protein